MDTAQALLSLRPGAQWSIPNGSSSASDVIWHDNTKPVTQAELDAEMAKPAPAQAPEPTLHEKLASIGLTIDQLKEALK